MAMPTAKHGMAKHGTARHGMTQRQIRTAARGALVMAAVGAVSAPLVCSTAFASLHRGPSGLEPHPCPLAPQGPQQGAFF